VANDDYKIRGIDGLDVDIESLAEYLKKFEAKIETIYYWKDEALQLKGWDTLESAFSSKISLIDPAQE